MTALQELADRLGLDPAPHLAADGRPRVLFLCVAGAVSLALWIGIGWAMVQAVTRLGELG